MVAELLRFFLCVWSALFWKRLLQIYMLAVLLDTSGHLKNDM